MDLLALSYDVMLFSVHAHASSGSVFDLRDVVNWCSHMPAFYCITWSNCTLDLQPNRFSIQFRERL